MSFGFSIGDIAIITRLSWKLYKSVKDSSADFARLSTELMSLHAVLSETTDFLEENNPELLPPSRRNRLNMLCEGVRATLEELDALVRRYESLGTQAQRTWDRMRFGCKDLSEVRGRLVSSTTMLGAFNTAMIKYVVGFVFVLFGMCHGVFFFFVPWYLRDGSGGVACCRRGISVPAWPLCYTRLSIIVTRTPPSTARHLTNNRDRDSSSTARIEKKLTKFMAEVQAGLREGSVVTTDDVAQTIDSPDVWAELRRELEDVGISAVVVEENHGYILSWMKEALAEDRLNEGSSCSPKQSTCVLEVGPGSDSGYGGSEGPRGSVSSSGMTLNAANDAFEEELKKQRDEWNPGGDEGLLGGDLADGGQLERTPSKVRRRTDPVGLVKKLFMKETAIIEAASDADCDKVAELIALGMDVNARDRWG